MPTAPSAGSLMHVRLSVFLLGNIEGNANGLLALLPRLQSLASPAGRPARGDLGMWPPMAARNLLVSFSTTPLRHLDLLHQLKF